MRGQRSHLTFLGREFFERRTDEVAADLIGCRLHRELPGPGGSVVAEIVECEAYLGTSDPASHAFSGPTPRSQVMFGPPGHLYVYLSYGVHHCVNVVTEVDGVAGAVLLRSALVLQGEEAIRTRRGRDVSNVNLLRGPGNLGKGLALHPFDTGLDICGEKPGLQFSAAGGEVQLCAGPRIGISKAVDEQLRFWNAKHTDVVSGAKRRAGDQMVLNRPFMPLKAAPRCSNSGY